ncbi:MAG: hypothetical protein JOZ54_07465 [Acidobacteria bacterium]|nr:hypothetical protein [Acidobacteriota bacterium]
MIVGCGRRAAEVRVGAHRFRIEVPRGWRVLQQGSRAVVRADSAEKQIVFTDLGPARPAAFRDEIRHARELWRSGRDAEALTLLRELPVRRELFAWDAEHERFRSLWETLASAPRGQPYEAVAATFDELIAAGLHPAPLDAIASSVPARLGEDDRYEQKSLDMHRIGEREAMAIETWRKLSHVDPRRCLVILDGDRILAMHCERCDDKAFADVAASLQFADASRT